jgi:AbrB family looped-hinge helix DNA binding protein
MKSATVSPKFQVVIPKEIRDVVPLKRGQKVHVIAKGGVITLVPDRPMTAMRGYLPGLDGSDLRDKSDRL